MAYSLSLSLSLSLSPFLFIGFDGGEREREREKEGENIRQTTVLLLLLVHVLWFTINSFLFQNVIISLVKCAFKICLLPREIIIIPLSFSKL